VSAAGEFAAFAASYAQLDAMCEWLSSDAAVGLTHAEVEDELGERGRELLRTLFQDHLDRLSREEERVEVIDAEGAPRRSVERGHQRRLATVFGEVIVDRLAYRRKGHPNLHPIDAALNLPAERHSHGLRRLAAIESSRGSFDGAVEGIERATGQAVGKRQVEQLAAAAAADFEDFYDTREVTAVEPDDIVVISADGKGVVMRPEALREQTAKAASSAKLTTRLSKGEKRNRKRMATVGAVYDVAPVPRSAADIMGGRDDPGTETDPPQGPTATNKWLRASIVDDAATAIGAVFDEAERRDPDHQRTWVALVDGNNHQIDRLRHEAAQRRIDLHIVCDFVHVLEYLWSAAWSFYDEGDPAAEEWVHENAIKVLEGHATRVAAAIRRKATYHRLPASQRANADRAAGYLTNKAAHLDYPTALTAGWPIATGVIEGACRHLVKDRMDITGARWGLDGAEAVLKLRALRANSDFDDYWQFHLRQERRRVHESRYADDTIPAAA
jgi:hypothetical protein